MPRSSFHPSFPMTPQTGLRYDVVFPVTPHVHIQRQRVHPQLHSSVLGELSYGTTPPRFHSRATETGLAGLVTAQSNNEPTIRVLSQQTFLQFTTEEELTLISVIAQRMLSRSPMVALYPYCPQAPYSRPHHVLSVADNVAFTPPSPTPLDADTTWDDAPIVVQHILIKDRMGLQLEQEERHAAAKKALSKPSSSPVFATSSPRPPPKEFVPVKDKSGEVFVPLVLSPMSGGYLPLEST
ncbi:hypothetical protein BLNAU_1936 [Blattamonas nauphoetae]|uniref:Uncharacterized protein n=1 Tax=Blattamonas nauphoetae TaxID=2049346 RepID=A0ABQ9YGM1_9EUKA|nr:hypothetical protein BLNAU_1936 [Blattamonas nauphoetae]